MDDLITITEAAKEIGCSRVWVFKLIQSGKLKAQQVGGIYILKRKDVDACDVRPRMKPGKNGHTSSGSRSKKNGTKAKAAKLPKSQRGR